MSYHSACIEWTGTRTAAGYGIQWRNGKRDYAHRIAWSDVNGPIPEGLFVCHTCDNPPCVNVSHFFLGSPADNMRDMVTKGRHWEQSKTHCPSGHELSGDNLTPHVLRAGKRQCLECRRRQTREAQRKYVAKKVSI